MKKIVTIVAAALIASAAFAQVSIGAWGRGFFTPFAYNGKDVVMQDGVSWGPAAAPRVGFTVAGSSENVGFVVDMNGDGGAIGAGDCQYIWVKPASMLNVMIGKTQDLTLRGDACFGLFNWLRVGGGKQGEDFIFTRVGNGDASQLKGALVTLDPIEGLHIAAGVDISNDNWASAGVKAADVVETGIQVAIGYKIANVGTIKAQYITKGNSTTIPNDDYETKTAHLSVIEAAFDLTAVENLFVSIGAKIPTADVFNADGNAQAAVPEVNAYGKFTAGAVTIHAIVGTKFNVLDTKLALEGKKPSEARGVGFLVGAGLDFGFENGLGINADVRYTSSLYNGQTSAENTDCIAFLVGLTKGFSNGLIGIGFEGSTNNNGPYVGAEAKEINVAVPVRVEYWF